MVILVNTDTGPTCVQSDCNVLCVWSYPGFLPCILTATNISTATVGHRQRLVPAQTHHFLQLYYIYYCAYVCCRFEPLPAELPW